MHTECDIFTEKRRCAQHETRNAIAKVMDTITQQNMLWCRYLNLPSKYGSQIRSDEQWKVRMIGMGFSNDELLQFTGVLILTSTVLGL